MRLIINGETYECRTYPTSLQALLQQLGFLADDPTAFSMRFVVALNQHIISSSRYASTALQEDDCIDVLSVITGG